MKLAVAIFLSGTVAWAAPGDDLRRCIRTIPVGRIFSEAQLGNYDGQITLLSRVIESGQEVRITLVEPDQIIEGVVDDIEGLRGGEKFLVNGCKFALHRIIQIEVLAE